MAERELNRILHVDDEPDIREVAKLALEGVGGFTVEACASGEEACEVAPRFKPDLILLDVMMPIMDGPSTLRALRDDDETAQIPIVFMTAKVQKLEIAEFKKLGAIDVIEKPFDPMTLSDQVKAIWSKCGG
jgi:CheY-like chemotaxis protein|tara:strand:- start:164 stop:556 length:393 start_codon:yes stop_codon:yes gene_type:complete